MKYCKEELKIIPKRLMVFKNSNSSEKSTKESGHSDHHDYSKTRGIMAEEEHRHHNNTPIDDSIGRIKRLIIGYTYYTSRREVNAFNKIYSDLVIKLSRTGEWADKTNAGEEQFLKISSIAPDKKALENLTRVNEAINTLAEFTGDYMKDKKNATNILGNSLQTQIWIQDDIIPVRNENNEIVLYGRLATNISSPQDNCPAEALSKAIKCKHHIVLNQQLAGGNLLFIGPFTLVGHNSLEEPETAYKPHGGYLTENQLKENLDCLFKDQRTIIIGDEVNEGIAESFSKIVNEGKDDITWLNTSRNSQPIFHLDLFITPAGLSKDGKYRLVIGDPITLLDRDETELLKKGGLFDKTRAAINKIAAQLSQYEELRVSRIPLPLSWADLVNESDKSTRRLWFFASYNNCLVQYTGQESEDNYVLLPKYGNSYSMEKSGYTIKKEEKDIKVKAGDWSELKEFEDQVRKHWNHLGFKTVFLTDYLPMIIRRGSLRCMIKVIDREPIIEQNSHVSAE